MLTFPGNGVLKVSFASFSGDCVDNTERRQRKRPACEFLGFLKKNENKILTDLPHIGISEARQRSNSPAEDHKRPRWTDQTGNSLHLDEIDKSPSGVRIMHLCDL